MVKFKSINDMKGYYGDVKPESQETMIKSVMMVTAILTKLQVIMKTENEFKEEVPDGMLFEDYQLSEIEDILVSNTETENIKLSTRIAISGQMGYGVSIARLRNGLTGFQAITEKLTELVDNMEMLSNEEIEGFKKEISNALANITYSFYRIFELSGTAYDLQRGFEEVEVNHQMLMYVAEKGITIEKVIEQLTDIMKNNKPVLELFEKYPDVWSDMMDSAEQSGMGSTLLYLSDYIIVEDIIKYQEGSLVIDEQYLDDLKERESLALRN